ncbi:hypothetical protein HPB48_011019 [Haemaphysalis longicornis]|uniref:Uncharacterized protein n=1 Tax=Haemaphysalis longicornis TaxID=44386 RepID=A0A9J6FV39_HAELO|nr:hypothetical protein HPB48_011019 [Haemaphysalis longicornis]
MFCPRLCWAEFGGGLETEASGGHLWGGRCSWRPVECPCPMQVKAECPLCKQRFKSIVHNVRSFEDYDRYFVSSGGPSSSASSSSHAALGSALLLAHHLVYSSPLLGADQWISRHMFAWRPRRRNGRTTAPGRRPR